MESIVYIGKNERAIQSIRNSKNAPKILIIKENALLANEYISSTIFTPTVIIVEYNLPGVGAYEFCQQLRNNPILTKIVYIVVKDQINRKESKDALEKGVDEIVPLDFEYDNIITRLKFLIDYRNNTSTNNINLREKQKSWIGLPKRIFDIAVATAALIALSPILIITIIAIRMESKGPVFYASKRVGSGYKIFDFYKFRSMRIDADQQLNKIKNQNQYATKNSTNIENYCPNCIPNGKSCSPILFVDGKEICENYHNKIKLAKAAGTFIKIKDDPRVTVVGKIIRNTSIDELPQLINVLKGDMSIVGNRPLPLYEAELLTSDAWAERFNAPAGITGLWQVEKRGSGVMSEEERKNLDNVYARNHSFLKDIQLIFKTVPALFQKENV